jgi:hypothetical protein
VRINGGSWNNRNIVFNVDIQKTGPPHPHYLLGRHCALIALIGTPGGGDSGRNIYIDFSLHRFYKIYLVIIYYVVRSGLKAEKGMKAVLQKKTLVYGQAHLISTNLHILVLAVLYH